MAVHRLSATHVRPELKRQRVSLQRHAQQHAQTTAMASRRQPCPGHPVRNCSAATRVQPAARLLAGAREPRRDRFRAAVPPGRSPRAATATSCPVGRRLAQCQMLPSLRRCWRTAADAGAPPAALLDVGAWLLAVLLRPEGGRARPARRQRRQLSLSAPRRHAAAPLPAEALLLALGRWEPAVIQPASARTQKQA